MRASRLSAGCHRPGLQHDFGARRCGKRSAVLYRVLSLEHRGARPAAGRRDGAAGKARRVARADPGIVAAGFLGMFICGGPVYVAGVTTSAINLALIMALAPLAVLLFSFISGQEAIHRDQIIGMLFSLAGAALIITKGQAAVGAGVAVGDLLALMAMLGWAGYTLLQNRVGSGVSFLARIGLFAAAGALFSLPFAVHEMWSAPSAAFNGRAALVYLFAGWSPAFLPIRPMPISARSSARCRRRSASISDRSSARCCRSCFLARRRPDLSDRWRAVARRHVVEPAGQGRVVALSDRLGVVSPLTIRYQLYNIIVI